MSKICNVLRCLSVVEKKLGRGIRKDLWVGGGIVVVILG